MIRLPILKNFRSYIKDENLSVYTEDLLSWLEIDLYEPLARRINWLIGNNGPRTKVVNLTSSEIKALAATPKELVAAPGAGKLIEFISALFILNYGSEVLAEPSAPDDLAIEYDNGDGQQIVTWDTTGFITSSEDAMEIIYSSGVSGGASAVMTAANVNKNIALINTGGEYTGNASGDTTMKVFVTYRLYENLGI
jgi:hypothetical protein